MDNAGNHAADCAGNAGRHHRLFQAQGNAVHGRFGDACEQRRDTGRNGHLAHIRILGPECDAEGRAGLRGIAAQHGRKQHILKSRVGQRHQAGRDKRPVHAGHDDERHRAGEQQHRKPRGKAVDCIDDQLQYIADHQAERRQQAQRDRRGDDHDQQRFQEVLGPVRRDLIDQDLHIFEQKGRQHGRNDGRRIAAVRHRDDAEQIGRRIAAEQRDHIRIEQHGGNHD